MECTPEARSFVAQHVGVFIKRHWRKLNQVFPAPELETTIKESGNTELLEAVAYLDNLDAELNALEKMRDEAIQDFKNAFGETVDSLMCDACTEHSKLLEEKQTAFEYKVRTAIGLVELVSPKKAYEVLESCRSQIEDLGK
jgi:hypothetical protein